MCNTKVCTTVTQLANILLLQNVVDKVWTQYKISGFNGYFATFGIVLQLPRRWWASKASEEELIWLGMHSSKSKMGANLLKLFYSSISSWNGVTVQPNNMVVRRKSFKHQDFFSFPRLSGMKVYTELCVPSVLG